MNDFLLEIVTSLQNSRTWTWTLHCQMVQIQIPTFQPIPIQPNLKKYEHTMMYAKKNNIYTNIQNIEYFFFIEIGIWLILLMAHIASLR